MAESQPTVDQFPTGPRFWTVVALLLLAVRVDPQGIADLATVLPLALTIHHATRTPRGTHDRHD